MKNKLIYIIAAVVVLAAVGGGLLLNKNKATKNETPTPTSSTGTTNSSSSAPSKSNSGQTASGSKVEEAYVELGAQTTYYTETNNQNGWTAQMEKDLLTRYGVTIEAVGTLSKELRNDPAHAKAVTIKVLQRTQELQRTGGN